MAIAIKRTQAPTRADFHRAIAARADRWYAACLKITRQPDLAEDAVQEALLSAWDKRSQFRHTASLETWIHRIAVNAALQILRRSRPGVFEPLDEEPADAGSTPDELQQQRDFGRGLAAALEVLSETERVCFLLKHFEQWRLREIADELDLSVNNVKQAVFRAVRKLRITAAGLRSEAV